MESIKPWGREPSLEDRNSARPKVGPSPRSNGRRHGEVTFQQASSYNWVSHTHRKTHKINKSM